MAPGTICRHPVDECDLPEHCTGESGACPKDVHMRDGVPCGGSVTQENTPGGQTEDGKYKTPYLYSHKFTF